MIKFFAQIIVLLATFLMTCVHSFNTSFVNKPEPFISSLNRNSRVLSPKQSLHMSSNDNGQKKPDLIDQSMFVSAVEMVKEAAAKENGIEFVKNENTGYAIGRLEVELSVPPSIDLVETPKLVLVNGVSPDAYESGIQTLDTIISVSSGTFQKKTKALNMDETVNVIKEAISHARENDCTTMTFELNRLLGGYYK